jgi:DNA primase
MPLAPRAEIERIKREVSVQRLAEARGIKLRRSGKELIGLCPFHKDTSPSLNIDPKKNHWHCKGACGEGGDVIQWVMRAQGVSFKHALEILRRDVLPMTATSPGPPPKKATTVKLPPLIERSTDDKQLLETIVAHYHETLKESPEAQQYLVKRGLQSAEMLQHFRLGLPTGLKRGQPELRYFSVYNLADAATQPMQSARLGLPYHPTGCGSA